MSGERAFLYVQHLLGIGHLKRAATLARALAARGLEVTLASGGFAVPGLALGEVRLVQLPPAGAADLGFVSLVDERGKPVDEHWKERRREALLAAWRETAPHALVLELFPFGRRQMRFELEPLLDAAAAAPRRPAIVCSVRDILGGGQKDPSKQDQMLETLERYFDHVLVHADPNVVRFEETFRHTHRIRDRLHYTGFLTDPGFPPDRPAAPLPRGETSGQGEVLVSAGGGAVGARLLEVAIRSRPLTHLAHRTWRVLAGTNASAEQFEALRALANRCGEGRVLVERARQDFSALLANCHLSVSQAGYNTVMEILQARARAVAVPFAGGNETEQTLRARLLAERGLLEIVEERALTPQALAAAIGRAARRERPRADGIDLGGAAMSAALIARWAAERR